VSFEWCSNQKNVCLSNDAKRIGRARSFGDNRTEGQERIARAKAKKFEKIKIKGRANYFWLTASGSCNPWAARPITAGPTQVAQRAKALVIRSPLVAASVGGDERSEGWRA